MDAITVLIARIRRQSVDLAHQQLAYLLVSVVIARRIETVYEPD
jgi:hypothetical protein